MRCASAPSANASTRPTTTVEISGAWCVMSLALERETIPQIAAVCDDVRNRPALALVYDQRVDLVELIHGDQLKHLDADRAVGAARKLRDKLQSLGRLG